MKITYQSKSRVHDYSMNRDRMMIVQIEMFICVYRNEKYTLLQFEVKFQKNGYSKFLKLKNGKWKLKHLFINGSALNNYSQRTKAQIQLQIKSVLADVMKQ
ncbi:hypothetical protein T03_15807 [Trichinella britovi]|uniref:Uncharacterized protein n=1 Tax=Trichinella britovi TaxID=45882 RepID=A0A0V1DBJ9_TRIBR|nr:hypothetical protein T03_15807 [Trichinella britovi]